MAVAKLGRTQFRPKTIHSGCLLAIPPNKNTTLLADVLERSRRATAPDTRGCPGLAMHLLWPSGTPSMHQTVRGSLVKAAAGSG